MDPTPMDPTPGDAGAAGGKRSRDFAIDQTMGIFTPHSANEGDQAATEWLQEVLPTDEHPVSDAHAEDHIPHGMRDVGPVQWTFAGLMLIVLGLLTYGFIMPALGLR